MQPDNSQTSGQQPAQQSAPSPTAPPAAGIQAPPQPVTPVVSLTPEAGAPASPSQPVPAQPQPVAASVQAVPAEQSATPLSPESAPEVPSGQVEMEPVRWQANEYIHREKNLLWFVIFTFVVMALIVVAIFVIKSFTFAILVPVMAAALLVYTHRPPRVLDYTLSRQGIHVNDHLYPFAEFKAFGVVRDGEEYSVMLVPTKRFKPGVSVYFPEEAGEAIVDMLGARLPMQELHLDAVDKIIRKLRI